jgi:hypothetical protein
VTANANGPTNSDNLEILRIPAPTWKSKMDARQTVPPTAKSDQRTETDFRCPLQGMYRSPARDCCIE